MILFYARYYIILILYARPVDSEQNIRCRQIKKKKKNEPAK